MISLIEKMKFWKTKAQDAKDGAYSAAEELLDIVLNDPSAKTFGIDAETASLMRREILVSVKKALSSENRVEAVRNIHGNLVGTVAEARELAIQNHRLTKQGIDPRLERDKIKAAAEAASNVLSFERAYLLNRFQLGGNSLKPLIITDLDVPLFPTQKRERFSNNTLAQHFCYLDKSIWQRFVVQQATKKASIAGRLLSSL